MNKKSLTIAILLTSTIASISGKPIDSIKSNYHESLFDNVNYCGKYNRPYQNMSEKDSINKLMKYVGFNKKSINNKSIPEDSLIDVTLKFENFDSNKYMISSIYVYNTDYYNFFLVCQTSMII